MICSKLIEIAQWQLPGNKNHLRGVANMLSEQFKTIIEPLKQAGEMNFHDGATEEEISAF